MAAIERHAAVEERAREKRRPASEGMQAPLTADKTYCVRLASGEVLIEHARCSGFRANRTKRVQTVVDSVAGAA